MHVVPTTCCTLCYCAGGGGGSSLLLTTQAEQPIELRMRQHVALTLVAHNCNWTHKCTRTSQHKAPLTGPPVAVSCDMLVDTATSTQAHAHAWASWCCGTRSAPLPADVCCTAAAPVCCGRTCMTATDAEETSCPIKQACCVPDGEDLEFDDCCDIYSICCGDECVIPPEPPGPYTAGAYFFCGHERSRCCPPGDGR